MDPRSDTIAYPTRTEVDAWLESIMELAESTPCAAQLLPDHGFTHNLGIRHTKGYQYVRFAPAELDVFYGYWQPALSTPAPLLVHVPGYGAEMSAHPDLVAAGYNVLHISPLGYSTPKGADLARQRDGNWPVLPDTILSGEAHGYRFWLADCAMAIRWAMAQPEVLDQRVSFFGTSQGGGGALLLGSLYRGRGARCVAADLPFLTDFRAADGRGAYAGAFRTLAAAPDKAAAWRTVGLIDTLSHAERLDLPVLLTAGGDDATCPPDTIESLFARLPATRSYTYLENTGHRYTTQFIPLAAAWFRLYA
ncbi:MAG: acetylxylan esterase [bacterium]|nr:acetylxylan esterase [bacterium]